MKFDNMAFRVFETNFSIAKHPLFQRYHDILQHNSTVYKRISLSDGDLGIDGKDESNSIENQKSLIDEYIAARQEFEGVPVLEFVDDGYSGTNFDRPGFQGMMESVRRGEVDTIIVKDACVIIEPTRKGPFERLSWPGSICF